MAQENSDLKKRLSRTCKEQQEENNLKSQRPNHHRTCKKIISYAESDAPFPFETISTVSDEVVDKKNTDLTENKCNQSGKENSDPDRTPVSLAKRKNMELRQQCSPQGADNMSSQETHIASSSASHTEPRAMDPIGSANILLPKENNITFLTQSELQKGDSSRKRCAPAEKSELKRLKDKDYVLLDGEYVRVEELRDDEANKTYSETPEFIEGIVMRSYQIRGLNWLIARFKERRHPILADEMGTGKTMQAVGLLGHLKKSIDGGEKFLLIVPKLVVHQWKKMFDVHCPSVRAEILEGNKQSREDRTKYLLMSETWDVVICSFETCHIEKVFIQALKWNTVIVDEAHRLKNQKGHHHVAIRSIKRKHMLFLTGTPMQNNVKELVTLLTLLKYKNANHLQDYVKDWRCIEFSNETAKVVHLQEQIANFLKPVMLRRWKYDVVPNFPPIHYYNILLTPTPLQKHWMKVIDEQRTGNEDSSLQLCLQTLERVNANRPDLMRTDPNDPDENETNAVHMERLLSDNSKLKALDFLLNTELPKGSRFIIFSGMVKTLNIIQQQCSHKGRICSRIDGDTTVKDREKRIQEFNELLSKTTIMLVSTQAGGEGINLSSANVVILFDSQWNPQRDNQAIARAHRPPQTKTVRVYRFVVKGTIEENILKRDTLKEKEFDFVMPKQVSIDKNKYRTIRLDDTEIRQSIANEVL